MGTIKRAGFQFVTWVGDHPPRHVHIYRNGRLVAKYDLENRQVVKGKASAKLSKCIKELSNEGLL